MKPSGAHGIEFADVRVTVQWQGEEARRMSDFLFGPSHPLSNRPDAARFHLAVEEGPSGRATLHRSGEPLYEGPDKGMVAGMLLDWVVRDLAGACRAGPVFHAAAVACGERGLLLPASSGAGKSTLAAILGAEGFRCLTDELACVESEPPKLLALSRPLHLRTSALGVLRQNGLLVAGWPFPGPIYFTERGVLLAPPSPGKEAFAGFVSPSLILFPRYAPGEKLRICALSPAQACASLMGCLVNARNLSGHGLREVSSLARKIPAFSMTYGDMAREREEILSFLRKQGFKSPPCEEASCTPPSGLPRSEKTPSSFLPGSSPTTIIGKPLPKASCYCITHGRTHLLEEALESFLRQDYEGPKELIILNDFVHQELIFDHPRVTVVNAGHQIATLGRKYNAAIALCSGDVLMPWDDDDIYLPWRISYSVERMRQGVFHTHQGWYEGQSGILTYTENLFQCNLAVDRALLHSLGGYADRDVSGVDEDLFKKLQGSQLTQRISPEDIFYIYRWPCTSSYHGSGWGIEKEGISTMAGEYVSNLLEKGEIPSGRILLDPHWIHDWTALACKAATEKNTII